MAKEDERNKMKKYAILQKKMEELESNIRSIVSGDDVDGSRQRLIEDSDGIEKKFQFLRHHIAAESSSPESGHHLSHLAARLEKLHADFSHVSSSLARDEPVDPIDFDDWSNCSCPESCLEDADKKKTVGGVFKVYDNPLSSNGHGDVDDDEGDDDDDEDSVTMEEAVVDEDERVGEVGSLSGGGGERWLYWRGVAAGAAAAVGSVVAVVLGYGVRCRFDEGVIGVFPPPT